MTLQSDSANSFSSITVKEVLWGAAVFLCDILQAAVRLSAPWIQEKHILISVMVD